MVDEDGAVEVPRDALRKLARESGGRFKHAPGEVPHLCDHRSCSPLRIHAMCEVQIPTSIPDLYL